MAKYCPRLLPYRSFILELLKLHGINIKMFGNNCVERSVRLFTVGRNNWWLFSNIHNGARAVLYSLVETAKANGSEPYESLEYVLREILKLKYGDNHRHILPWNMPKAGPPSSKKNTLE